MEPLGRFQHQQSKRSVGKAEPERVRANEGCQAELDAKFIGTLSLPLVSREWKNGSSSSFSCTPFLHSLLTKGKLGGRGLYFLKQALLSPYYRY